LETEQGYSEKRSKAHFFLPGSAILTFLMSWWKTGSVIWGKKDSQEGTNVLFCLVLRTHSAHLTVSLHLLSPIRPVSFG